MGGSGGGGGGTLYFLVCQIALKGLMGGARDGEYYLSKPHWYSGKIRSWQTGARSARARTRGQNPLVTI